MIFVQVISGFIAWILLGCVVLAIVDSEDEALRKWAAAGPTGLVVLFWPVTVYFWYSRGNGGRNGNP